MSFLDLLHQVRDTALGAYAHQDVPFEKVVEALQPERNLSYTPLFQVMFALQDEALSHAELPDLTLTSYETEFGTAKCDLTLTMTEAANGLQVAFEYSRDLFDEATMRRMGEHLQTLLTGIVEAPEQAISRLPLVTAAERQQVLAWAEGLSAGRAHTQPDACIHHRFEQSVAMHPDRLALSYEQEHLTYRELNERANRLAHLLHQQGVGAESLVGVCLDRSPEMVVALLAVLKAGGAYVPLDPTYPEERIAFVLEDAAVDALVTAEQYLDKAPSGLTTICVDRDAAQIAEQSGDNLNVDVHADNLAYVIYTSGSTGKPKGVLIPHRNVIRLFTETRDWYGFNQEDVWTLFHSYAFDFSVWEIWGALFYGGRLVVVPYLTTRSPEAFYDLLVQERVTVLNQTPSAFRQLIAAEEMRGRSQDLALRYVIFGGEALELQSLNPWFNRHGDEQPRLVNMYGITETTVHVTYREITRADVEANRGSVIGQPIPDLQVYVLDRHLEPAPIGVVGELYVGGAGLARGYLNRPELTAERFTANPFAKGSPEATSRLYKTGDLARYLADGELEYQGRSDHQVKVRGFRIELGEIESTLLKQEAVREAVVLVREDTPGDKRLVAYLVPAQGDDDLPPIDLPQALRSDLPDYMIPNAYVWLDALPLTPNGKTDTRALPAPEYGGGGDRVQTAPRTETEQRLADLFTETLGVEKVGVESDFFTLGGHSLLAMQLVSRAREQFGSDLSMRDLFEAPTLGGLAERIERGQGTANRPALVPLDRADGNNWPVSFAQERLWLLDQIAPGESAYNIPIAVRLQGRLDAEALERSLQALVARHETLRTTFANTDGQPVQVIHAAQDLPLQTILLDTLPEAQRESEVERLAREEARQPFDLAKGSLVRAKLLRLTSDDHVLLLTMHHIVSDGWSMGVLVRDLSELYGAVANGQNPSLPPLDIQYADYARWQRQWLQGDVLDGQIDYWKQTLGDGVPVLQLPTDRPRPPVRNTDGGLCQTRLPKSLTDRLNDLSRREDVTLFMTLLSAFNVLLHRYSGQDDIAVGTPIANRSHAQAEGLIGFFVNTLVLRSQLSSEMSFRELLQQVRETSLGAYAHQDVPFEKLVEVLQPERDMSYTPLFQVMFALQEESLSQVELSDLTLTPYETGFGTAKFDLTLTMTETADGLQTGLEYSRDLFDEATAQRLLAHLTTLLEAVVEQPEQSLSQLPLLTEAERERQVKAWRTEPVAYPTDLRLHHLLERRAEATPDAVAVVFEDERLTYRELNERANRVAHRLLDLPGGAEEKIVGLLTDRSLEMVVGMYGILKAGQAYLPLDPSLPTDRLRFMLEDAAVSVVLTTKAVSERVAGLGGEQADSLLLDQDEALTSASGANPQLDLPEDRLAYVIYTSGSTGRPKGVMIPHRAIVNHMLWMQADYPLTAQDAVLQKTPFGFDASVWEFHAPLLAGARLVLAEPDGHQDSRYLVDAVIAHGITRLQLVPSMLQAFLEEPNVAEIKTLHHLFCGGEALPPATVKRVFERLPHTAVHNLYGPTETCIDAIVWDCRPEGGQGHIPIGHPIHNVHAYVLDEHRQPVPVGVPGELYIGGAGLARGYLNRAELTEQTFIRNPFGGEEASRLYKTGDLVRYLPNGALAYLGRIDQQVKIRGHRIELGEIQTLLLQQSSVREAAVIDGTDKSGTKRLVAYLVPSRTEEELDPQAISATLREQLPEYMVPDAYVFLDRLPLTHNGKLDRRALPEPDFVLRDASVEYVAPRNEREAKIARIWSELLQVEPVGVHDNFFALGGHSLLATVLASRVRQEYQVELPLRKLFETPTVAAVAAAIEASAEQQTAPPQEGKIVARGRERRRVRS
ncbi:MAG TPA: amino acid adenylation domain-containing protein [Bacilli bacterium]|nr:amino acid adenylation domain-containing protein [Bacilli bacterium]